jgi:hypothetical protein
VNNRDFEIAFQNSGVPPDTAYKFAQLLEARAQLERDFLRAELALLKARIDQLLGLRLAVVLLTVAVAIAVCLEQSLIR